MGNNRKHSKRFDPTDEERTEAIQKAKTHHKKYGVVDMDRKREWLKQRGYAFQLIFKELKLQGYGEFKQLENVGNFNKMYINIDTLIKDIPYYQDMPEGKNIDKVKVMKILIEAIIKKDDFESSYLTKENYKREVESIKRSIETIQFEYLERMSEVVQRINQPLPRLTEYYIPLHPNDNYKIALEKLLNLNINKDIVENLLETALEMKNVKTTKHYSVNKQKIIKKNADKLIQDLHKSVDIKCHDLSDEVRNALKEITTDTIKKFMPNS